MPKLVFPSIEAKSQDIILNGRQSNISPDNRLVINRQSRFPPPIINGQMPTDVNINGITRMSVLSGCVLNLPLYHPILSPSPFKSLDIYAHPCTVTGALWTPQGRLFDGDDKIAVANTTKLSTELTEGTLEVWAKATTVGKNNRIIDQNTYMTRYSSGNKFNLQLWNGSAWTNLMGTTNLLVNTWYHLVGTFTVAANGPYVMYINGAVEASGTQTTATRTGAVTIGGVVAGEQMSGLIGEATVYSRILSVSEIQQRYQMTRWGYS